MIDTFVNPNPKTLEVQTVERVDIALSHEQNVAVRSLIKIREQMAANVERERCAKIAEQWREWSIHKGWDSEEYTPEEIAEKIRSGE
jgi:hypothetical protein